MCIGCMFVYELTFDSYIQGKVREIYEANDNTLLLAASDRISAYDVILENGVREKGAVLTRTVPFQQISL